jgi:uncharacterized protein YjbI with pentapeptide repeats
VSDPEFLDSYTAGRRDFSFTNIDVGDCTGRDFSGINLTGAHLGGGTMSNINLGEARLFGILAVSLGKRGYFYPVCRLAVRELGID